MLFDLYFHHHYQRADVHGSGVLKPYREADPFLSDDEHVALVRDKWDAIEQVRDRDQFRDATKKIRPARAPNTPASSSEHSEESLDMVAVPSIIATHWPVAADEIAAQALAKARQQAQEDEALVLILSGLL